MGLFSSYHKRAITWGIWTLGAYGLMMLLMHFAPDHTTKPVVYLLGWCVGTIGGLLFADRASVERRQSELDSKRMESSIEAYAAKRYEDVLGPSLFLAKLRGMGVRTAWPAFTLSHLQRAPELIPLIEAGVEKALDVFKSNGPQLSLQITYKYGGRYTLLVMVRMRSYPDDVLAQIDSINEEISKSQTGTQALDLWFRLATDFQSPLDP